LEQSTRSPDEAHSAIQVKVTIDPETHKFIRIGRITEAGRFRAEWDAVLTHLHLLWGGQWANPNQ
jgi:hypothetical protein